MTRDKIKTTTAAKATVEQQAFFEKQGRRVNFQFNPNDDLKNQFRALAALRSWVEGEDRWIAHWHVCFHEKYVKTTTAPAQWRAALASQKQQDFFQKQGKKVDFKVDLSVDPKDQFEVLAGRLGWVKGSDRWKSHWMACFNEKYILPTSEANSITNGLAALNIGKDYDDSNTRGWAAASSVGSTDTSSDVATDYPPSSTGTPIGVWDGFPGFTPDPTASFEKEFKRLARSQNWTKQERYERRIAMFSADFEDHMGDDTKDLGKWQKLCEMCGIEPVPGSITQCKKALEKINVNIYDLLNSERTGAKVRIFPKFWAFVVHTRNGRMFPLDRAKQDSFLRIFLKKLLPLGNSQRVP